MIQYSKRITAQDNKFLSFTSIGSAIRQNQVRLIISNLPLQNGTYQWLVKSSITAPDNTALAAGNGAISGDTLTAVFNIVAPTFVVGTTYYFALRVFTPASTSFECVQISFTVSQNAVLGAGTNTVDLLPIYIPQLTTTQRNALNQSTPAIIYNTTTAQYERYNPVSNSWESWGGGGGGDFIPRNNGSFIGTLTNGAVTTLVQLTGDATGNDSQQFPVSKSTPRIDLATAQVSEYDAGDPDKGGYSEMIRLKSLQSKAKPTIAWYDADDRPITWLVGHQWAQNLRIFANFAAFPVTGVNDNLTAYLDSATGSGYYWNGSSYVLLTPSDERWWYMWNHLHTSWESCDSTGTSIYTRFGVRYGFNVVDVEVVNAHFRVKNGAHKGTNYGAVIFDEGKIYSENSVIIYPNSTIRTEMLNKNDNTDNVFNSNSGGFRIEKLQVGASGNPTGNVALLVGTDTAIADVIQNRKTTYTQRMGTFNQPNIVEYSSGDATTHYSRGSGTLADANRRWSAGMLANDGYGIIRRSGTGSFVNTPFFIDTTGQVGVNTTNPNANLHVVGTTTLQGAVDLAGTAGAGAITYPTQSSAPTTPASGFRLFADALNRLAWRGANGFLRIFDGLANTADRTYTLPDKDGTVALMSDVNSDIVTTAYQALGSNFAAQTVGFNLQNSNTAITMGDNVARIGAVYLAKRTTILGANIYIRTTGVFTPDQNNEVGLYSYASGSLTRVAISANDPTIWTATANSLRQVPFQSSVTLDPGVYFVALLYNASAQTTNPQIAAGATMNNTNQSDVNFTNSIKLYSQLTAINALPATIAATSLSSSAAPIWVSLYS